MSTNRDEVIKRLQTKNALDAERYISNVGRAFETLKNGLKSSISDPIQMTIIQFGARENILKQILNVAKSTEDKKTWKHIKKELINYILNVSKDVNISREKAYLAQKYLANHIFNEAIDKHYREGKFEPKKTNARIKLDNHFSKMEKLHRKLDKTVIKNKNYKPPF